MRGTIMPIQSTPQWSQLGEVNPRALVGTRETLHHAAYLLALAGASYLEAQADDSHTSMSWLDAARALATQPIGANTRFRFALRIFDLTLLVIDDVSGEERRAFPLAGRTRSDALDWMRGEAVGLGLDGARLRSRLHFVIANHPTDNGAAFERRTDGALEELARWYADANIVLEERRRAMVGAGPVRSWPHHFDIATLVRLPHRGQLETIGIGLSPGDDSYGEPYYYVGPYPSPTATPRPLPIGTWHTSSWWGAALAGSDIVKEREPVAQAALVRRFVDVAVERLIEINGARA